MKEKKQKTKPDLEKEKLELEIREISKPWYKKSNWWTVGITAVAVAGTLVITLFTGFIDVSRERLENEKALLGMEVREFRGIRDSLQREMMQLHDSLDHVRDTVRIKNAELIASLEENKQMRREMFAAEQSSQAMFEYYENYIDSLITYQRQAEDIEKTISYKAISYGESGVIHYPGVGTILYPTSSN